MQRALTPIVAGLTTDFNITRSGVNGSGLFQALVLRFSTVAEVTAGLARRVVPTGGEHPDRGRRVERVSEGPDRRRELVDATSHDAVGGAISKVDVPTPEVYEFPCQACGASLEFSPGAQKLVCTHCGATQDLESGRQEPILEHSFDEASKRAKRVKAKDLMDDGVETRCDGCGARAIITGAATRCAFCDSPVVIAPSEDELFSPQSLLPFEIDGTRAKKTLSKWLSSRWFAPSDLVRRARRQGIDGVYVPYWCFDADTKTRYFGKRGRHYEVQVGDTTVRKTKWRPTAGVVALRFDDVLVPATHSIPRGILDRLEPWDLEELLTFETAYLSGFQAERYAIGLDDGFGVAKAKMKAEIHQAVRSDIGGDAQRVLSMHCRHSGVTFKHCLLPLWISSYRYGDDVYRFVVNARTGEATGERPYSVVKIGLLIAAIVALVLLWLHYRG